MSKTSKTKILKSNQEQAVAAWNEYLRIIRLSDLSDQLAIQDNNYLDAIQQMYIIRDFIYNPEHILGTNLTKHGEIAEQMDVGFSNAEDIIQGKMPIYSFEGVGRLSKEDYLRNGKMIQSKFNNSPNKTLNAINGHMNDYPNFISEFGTYCVPKDQYEIYKDIYNRGINNRSSLIKNSGYGNEERIFTKLIDIETKTGKKFDEIIYPSKVNYKEVQLFRANETLEDENNKISELHIERKTKIKRDHQPNFNEGSKVVAFSVTAEMTSSFILAFIEKKKEKKNISSFDENDWMYILKESGVGVIKGGIRGAALYSITNFYGMPDAITNALVTATFGIITQAKQLSNGVITANQFLDNCELMCLDVSISALSSILGNAIIPIPIIGAIIGNTIGQFMEQISISYLGSLETNIINDYNKKNKEDLNLLIAKEYNNLSQYLEIINNKSALLDLVFDAETNERLYNSIELAKMSGVDNDKIIRNKNDLDNFFNDDNNNSLN